jgi:hypothetical protein
VLATGILARGWSRLFGHHYDSRLRCQASTINLTLSTLPALDIFAVFGF